MPTVQDRLRAKLAEAEARKAQQEAAGSPTPAAAVSGNQVLSEDMTAIFSKFYDKDQAKLEPDEKRSETDLMIDSRLETLGIVEAYNLYIHKMVPDARGKTESIMISCPWPWHEDKNPSAWMNSEKNTFHCAACNRGGDQFDLAAIGKGYDIDTYKKENFGELRRSIAEDLGLTIEYIAGLGWTHVKQVVLPAETATEADAPTPEAAPPAEVAVRASSGAEDDVQGAGTVVSPVESDGDVEPASTWDNTNVPSLDWQSICPPNTFLDSYMRACTVDDVPEEYHFWHAMIGLSLVSGRDTVLMDSPPVNSNLFVCLMGPTGNGKSKAKRYIASILDEVAPYDSTSPMGSDGVKMVPTPGSAEAMVSAFSHPIRDPRNPKVLMGHAPVRGLTSFDEFKGLVQRINRQGNTMDTTLMEFYDSNRVITRKSLTHGEMTAQEPHCCVLATVQPEVLKDLLTESDEDSGFLNRWLFVGGPSKPRPMFNKVNVDISHPLKKMEEVKKWANKSHLVQFTPEAMKVYEDAWTGYIQADVRAAGAMFIRIDLTLKKLALILAINEMSDMVTKDMAERVLKMYGYLKSFVSIRDEKMHKNEHIRYEDSLAEAIKSIGKPAKPRDILRRIPKKNQQSSAVTNRTLEAMMNAGTLQSFKIAPGPKGGRPTVAYWFADQEVPS